MLLFPDGRLPSPRWRPAARVILVAWGLSILLNTLGPSDDKRYDLKLWMIPLRESATYPPA
jgi:hypothetical protein